MSASARRVYARAIELVLVAGFLGSACMLFAPSEEDVQNDFAVVVDESNRCSAPDECTSVSVGCPLPCAVSVRKDRAAEVERKGRELVEDYESGGRSCAYECVGPQTPTCKNGRCGFTEQ